MFDVIVKNGNIFESNCNALVNPCNCVGVSGKGLAYQFKKRFPDSQKVYEDYAKNGNLLPGTVLVTYETILSGKLSPDIIFFPTKRHWRDDSQIEDIRDGLIALRQNILDEGYPSIAIPALGAGLGGLNWSDVFRLIDEILSPISERCEIKVYEPFI